MAAGVFDVDTALDQLDWYPYIDTGSSNKGVCDQSSPADLLPEWMELPMVQSQFPAQEHDDQVQQQLFDEILDVPGYSSPKEALPTSPHSVLEQVSPTTTEAKYDQDLMEDDIHQFHSEVEDFYPSSQLLLNDEFIGCRLFHLLLAGAEAMFSQTLDLARVILFRLKELSSCSSTCPVFQRIAFYFTEGLQSLLDGTRIAKVVSSNISYLDTLTAFQALHEASPYIKFGHYVANQAILEAIADDKRVHIIDYDISVGIQWPSLMQALAMREGGAPHLRITAIYRPHCKNQLFNFHETKDRLMECAAAFRVPFTFHQAKVEDDEDSKLVGLKLVKGETIIVNCMLHLLHMPHKSPASATAFLRSVHSLSPSLVTFVEEEVMSPGSPNTVEKFFQALHHYSAVMDSLEASLGETKAHILVERAFLGTRIKTALIAGHRHPLVEDWASILSSTGFEQLPLSRRNVCQAKLLLGLFKDGYQLEDSRLEEATTLRLSWKSRPMMAASAWRCKTSDEEKLQ